jgi:hypothetical protein
MGRVGWWQMGGRWQQNGENGQKANKNHSFLCQKAAFFMPETNGFYVKKHRFLVA